MKYVNIDGRRFEVKEVGQEQFDEHLFYATVYNGRNLNDVYSHYSQNKLEIYNEWRKWAVDNSIYFGIKSYNSNIFTLIGTINIDDVEFVCYITPYRNILYTIKGNKQMLDIVSRETINL